MDQEMDPALKPTSAPGASRNSQEFSYNPFLQKTDYTAKWPAASNKLRNVDDDQGDVL